VQQPFKQKMSLPIQKACETIFCSSEKSLKVEITGFDLRGLQILLAMERRFS
jgi:hypothetical protein